MYGLRGDCTMTGRVEFDLSNEVKRPLHVETIILLLHAVGFSNSGKIVYLILNYFLNRKGL